MCLRSTSPNRGRVSASTSMRTSNRSTSSARTRRAPSPSSRACSRTSTSSISRRTVTVRARPSPGICSKRSNRASRSNGWCSTRSPSRRSGPPRKAHVTWTSTWSTRRRPGASWTGSTATRSHPCCGRRWRRSCRPAACSRWRPASSSQRERERMAFRSAGYWDVTAELDASVSDPQAAPPKFTAKLNTVDGRRVATGRDFDSLGAVRKPDEVRVLDEAAAAALATGLRGAQLTVSSVEQKPYTRKPYPPFMTSTLQQEAGRKLRFTSERTMSIAQRLYENGYITYMRTDSTTLSESAINAARNAGRPALRPGVRAPHPAPVHPQGEERAGGPRGDPPRRRRVPDPGSVAQRAGHRRVPALRADLAAHRGLADGRRARHHTEPADRRPGRRWRAGRVQRLRAHHHLPGFPEGLRREPGRPGRWRGRRRREPPAQPHPGAAGRRRRSHRRRAHHLAPGPLHRGLADQGAGRPGYRAAVDLQLDHQDDPGPRLRRTRRAARWCRPGWRSR